MSAHAFREHGIAFQPIDEVNKYDGLSLLNEQGDLYFLLTNFGMSHKPLWIEETKKKKLLWEEKVKLKAWTKWRMQITTKATTRGTFWVNVV